MSVFSQKLLPKVKITLREASTDFDEEIESYIDTCAADLQDAGILSSYFPEDDSEVDGRILQAVRWYCLSVYGLYNADMEKYAKAYGSLKATLCSQRRYTKGISGGTENGGYDLGYADGYKKGEEDGFNNAKNRLSTLSATENGDYTPQGQYIGFRSVSVSVDTSDAYQEGFSKGREDGYNDALSSLKTLSVSANGTYTPNAEEFGYNKVIVSVPERLPVLQEKTVTENGEVTPDEGYDGLSKVVVNVPQTGGGSTEEKWLFKDEQLTTEPRTDLPAPVAGVSYTLFVDGVEIATETAYENGGIDFTAYDLGVWVYYSDAMGVWGWLFHPIESSVTSGTVSIRINEAAGGGEEESEYRVELGLDCVARVLGSDLSKIQWVDYWLYDENDDEVACLDVRGTEVDFSDYIVQAEEYTYYVEACVVFDDTGNDSLWISSERVQFN